MDSLPLASPRHLASNSPISWHSPHNLGNLPTLSGGQPLCLHLLFTCLRNSSDEDSWQTASSVRCSTPKQLTLRFLSSPPLSVPPPMHPICPCRVYHAGLLPSVRRSPPLVLAISQSLWAHLVATPLLCQVVHLSSYRLPRPHVHLRRHVALRSSLPLCSPGRVRVVLLHLLHVLLDFQQMRLVSLLSARPHTVRPILLVQPSELASTALPELDVLPILISCFFFLLSWRIIFLVSKICSGPSAFTRYS